VAVPRGEKKISLLRISVVTAVMRGLLVLACGGAVAPFIYRLS